MSRFDREAEATARRIISRYPVPRSALIPLLHLAQEQDGYVAEDAMAHIAELLDLTPAEVLGTCSFYEMFKLEPVGRYVVNVCTDIACQFTGGPELLEHAEETLGIPAGATTADGTVTLEDVECIAACTEGPCLQVNYRYRLRVDHDQFDQLVDDLRAGRADDIPEHGVLARTRQSISPERRAGVLAPEDASEAPVWLARNDEGATA